MSKQWYLFIAAATLMACEASHAEAPPREPLVEATPVRLAGVVSRAVDAPLRATGRVAHVRDHKPAFKTGGLVKEVLVDEGDQVVKGQVLARLDTREIDAGMAQARAALDKARRDLARVEQLVGESVLPVTTREDAETAATVARAQLAGLAFNRETAIVTASADGVVLRRLVQPGEVVGPGLPIVVIGEAAPDRFELEVGVPAREGGRIAIGDRDVRVELDDRDGELSGVVKEIAPSLVPGTDRVTVTLEVVCTGALPPRGLVGVATFAPRSGVQRPAVPVSALVEGDGVRASVWLPDPAKADHVVRREIVVARIDADGMAIVNDGLDGVREVIDAGNAWLDEGSVVRVVRDAPEGSR